MKIEVDNEVKKYYNFDFERHIENILSRIPKKDLIGLYRIQVISGSPEKNRRNAYGFYYGKNESEQYPRIVICVGNIFRLFPPFFFRFLPALPKLFLVRTLFHEIGHHRYVLSHGFDKKEQEKGAQAYSKQMMKERYRFELFFIYLIFWPFLFIRFVLKRVGKW